MSRGLGQLVPYTECQYPQVLPFSIGQESAVINSGGLADYVAPFPFPIPQYLTPGNNRGLGCGDCGGTCGCAGLGLFDSSDFNDWGFAEWATVAVVAWGLISMFTTTKRGVSKLSGTVRKSRARSKRKAKLKKELAEL